MRRIFQHILLASAALSGFGLWGQTATFFRGRMAKPSISTTAVATADFNEDGKVDVLAATPFTLSVWPGNGAGSFGAPLNSTLNYSCADTLIVADFNRDGHRDALCRFSTGFEVALGLGNGSFQTPVVTTANVSLLGEGDFNGDGIPDVVGVNGNELLYFPGNGDGTFKAPHSVRLHVAPSSLATGDINGDGLTDVVTAYKNIIGIYFTASRPTRQVVTLQVTSVTGLAVADLNNDGRQDIVATVNASEPGVNESRLAVLLQQADGSFAITYYAGLNALYNPAIADLNGDGLPDVTATTTMPATPGLVTFLNAGGGSLAAPANYFAPVAQYSAAITGHAAVPDVVFTDGNSLQVLYNQGNGTFGQEVQLQPGTAGSPCQLGDFSGDGLQDLACLNSDHIAIYFRQLSLVTPYVLFQNVALLAPAQGIALGDFNNDGKLDIAAVLADGTIAFIENQGSAGFMMLPQRSNGGPVASAISSGDFNGDGNIDLVTTAGYFLAGQGDGTFAPPVQFTTDSAFASLSVASLTGNGKLDLIGMLTAGGTPTIFLGLGNGQFSASPLTGVSSRYPPAIADLNGDGKLDLAIATGSSGVTILLGRGDGTFINFNTLHHDFWPPYVSVAAADFTGDGIPDLAFGMTDSVWVMTGNGNGTFGPAQSGWGVVDPTTLLVANVTATSKPALLAGTSTMTVLQSK